MTRNKLTDLNDHLFAQLERLAEEDLSSEKLADEVQRAEAIVSLSDQIIRTADLQLKAVTVIASHGDRFRTMLPMIEAKAPYQDGSA
jgi:hypothetical protein